MVNPNNLDITDPVKEFFLADEEFKTVERSDEEVAEIDFSPKSLKKSLMSLE